jgi:hypothetical protein
MMDTLQASYYKKEISISSFILSTNRSVMLCGHGTITLCIVWLCHIIIMGSRGLYSQAIFMTQIAKQYSNTSQLDTTKRGDARVIYPNADSCDLWLSDWEKRNMNREIPLYVFL